MRIRAKLSRILSLLVLLGIATAGFAQIVITPSTFPTAAVEQQVAIAEASGGTAPYNWTLVSGSLPPGLALAATATDNQTNVVTGALAAPGNFTYTLQVTDSSTPAQTAAITYTTVVTTSALGFSTLSLPGGLIGSAYPPAPAAKGGEAPYSWTFVSGTLPPGLTLSPTTPDVVTGAITGTPGNSPGTYSFTLQVTDSSATPLAATQTFAISVANLQQQPEPAQGQPTAITTGPDRALWYNFTNNFVLTDPNGNPIYGIGRVTTAFNFTNPAFPLPIEPEFGSATPLEATQIVSGPDGNLWFTENGYIGEMSTSGVVGLEFLIPQTLKGSGGSATAQGLAPGPDNAIWFTLSLGDVNNVLYPAIGRLATTPDHTFTYYPITTNPAGGPSNIVTGPDGALWFADTGTDQNGNAVVSIGRMTTAGVLSPPPGCTSSTLECPIAGTVVYAGSAVSNGITTGPDGAIWFTDSIGNQIGRITTDGKSISLYPLPTAQSGVNQIVTGSDGALWFTEQAAMNIGRITTSGVVSEFAVGGPVVGITPGPDGALWTVDGNNVNRLLPPLALSCNLPSSLEVGITFAAGVGCPALGGKSPYHYSVSAGALPAGLTLNPTTGAITGTPTTAGPYSFTVLATDTSSPAETASQIVNETVAPRPPLTFSCTIPSGAQVTLPYVAACATGGGIPPYTYSVSAGTLPAGLTLTPTATGLTISGTPTAYGTFSFTLQATDSGTPQFTATQQAAAFTVLPPPLKMSCQFAAKAEMGVPYIKTCSATGGVPPYKFLIAGAGVPSWLSVQNAATGVLGGTPITAGTFSFSVQVNDSGPPVQTVTTAATLTVIPPKLGVMCDFSKLGTVGTAYSTACVTTNGVAPNHFTISIGTLPAGLVINAATGAITGRSTASGAFPFTVQVRDNNSPAQTAIQNVNFNVLSVALKIVSTTLPDGAMDLPYSGNPLAEGGTGPYAWSLKTGTLPAGLTLNPATGAITGAPTVSGPYSYTLQVADSSPSKQTAVQAFTGTISVPVVQDFTEYPLPAGSGINGIASGPDGALWFTTLNQPAGNLIGRITTAGVLTTYPSPNPLSIVPVPGGITTGPDGTLWFAEESSSLVGQISTDGAFSIDYATTTTSAAPQQITAGPDGALWFTESAASQIGRMSSSGVILNEFPTPSPTALPSGIVVGPDNAIWFTESTTDKIGRITTSGVRTTEYPIPTAGGAPTSIALGPDGALWFTESGAAKIGRITMTGAITEFPTPTAASGPEGITAGADGTLYFTETNANQIGRITTNGVITEYAVPTAAAGLQGLTLGSDGALWIAEGATNKIARFTFVTQLALNCTFPASTPVPLGTAYAGSCTASRGLPPYSYQVSKGSLPPGVTLDPATGVLSGSVTAPGTFTFTVQATDTSDPVQTAAQVSPSFTVLPASLTLSCTIPTSGQTGTAYISTCSPTGGTAPYNYAISAGSLPNGLTLDPAAGAISGTPTVPGTFTFTVQVADSSSPAQTAAQSFTVVIQLGPSTGGGGSLFTFGGLPTAQLPATDLANVVVQVAQPFPVAIQGTVTLGFTPYTGDGNSNFTVPSGYTDPAFQFVDGSGKPLGLTYDFTLPAGATSVVIPSIDPGTVAGTISLAVTTNGTPQAIPGSVFVEAAAPIIEAGSVQFANVTASSFDVELVVTDVTLASSQATFTFTPASGAALQGVSNFTIDLNKSVGNWYGSSNGLNFGGVFSLTVPFSLSGPVSAIDSVTVTVGNAFGLSQPVTGKR